MAIKLHCGGVPNQLSPKHRFYRWLFEWSLRCLIFSFSFRKDSHEYDRQRLCLLSFGIWLFLTSDSVSEHKFQWPGKADFFSDVTDRGLAVLISWVFLADINMSCFPLKGQTCSGGTSPGVIRCFVFCKYPTTLSIMSIVLTIGSQRWITGTKRKLIYVQTLSQYKPKEIG